eukprot:3379179-Ditylum_brightwellii.AAC.1
MQYFEYYIIEEKEEENIRLMLEAGEEIERNMVGNEDDIDPDIFDGHDSSAAAVLDGDICGEEVIPTAMLKSKEYTPQRIKYPIQCLYTSTSIENNLFPTIQQMIKQTTLFFYNF